MELSTIYKYLYVETNGNLKLTETEFLKLSRIRLIDQKKMFEVEITYSEKNTKKLYKVSTLEEFLIEFNKYINELLLASGVIVGIKYNKTFEGKPTNSFIGDDYLVNTTKEIVDNNLVTRHYYAKLIYKGW